jgi:hypothetical protein
VADADPNTAICTWTEGNNQPQRDGTWIAAVDISPGGQQGENADTRLLWKEQFDGRKDHGDYKTYSVRMNQVRVMQPNPDGTLTRTNQLIVYASDLQGKNRDNKKGGTYRTQNFAVVQADKTGLTYITPKTDLTDTLLGIDATHITMCPGVFGVDGALQPGFTMLQGSHNGGGVQDPVVKAIAYDPTTKTFKDLGTHRAGGSYDRHLYSNYLGNNPGNQGRNFAGCTLIHNPYVGQNGNLQQYFVVHALTGKDPMYVNNAALKQTSYVSMVPIATMSKPVPPPSPTPPPTGGNMGTGTGTGPGTGGGTGGHTTPVGDTPQDNSGGTPSMMGCQTAPGSSSSSALGGLFIVIGLGILVVRRRS